MTRARRSVIALAVLVLAGAGCGNKSTRYESAVQIVRKEAIEKDKDVVTAVDFEVEWDACPGDQFQVIRGSKEFAACTAKYEVGDYVPVMVTHFWDPRGFYRWDIDRFGDCAREIEPDSHGSYEKSAECRDVVHHGRTVGFECSRKPFRALLKRCPWMARD